MIVLEREWSYLKTLYYNGKEIKGFVFYNNDGIIYETSMGWFDNELASYPKAQEKIVLTQVRNARVVKMENKDNFIIKGYVYIYCGQDSDFEYKETLHTRKEYDTYIHEYETYIFYAKNTNEDIGIQKCVKVEKNDKGKLIEEVCEMLESRNIHIGRIEVQKMLELGLLKVDLLKAQ